MNSASCRFWAAMPCRSKTVASGAMLLSTPVVRSSRRIDAKVSVTAVMPARSPWLA